MSDREMLELAAKAAGLHFHGHRETKTISAAWVSTTGETDDWFSWNPITDDGDALRLAVKLGLICGFVQPNCWAELPGQYPSYEPCEPDPFAATRRAIVRAAAEIGKQMP